MSRCTCLLPLNLRVYEPHEFSTQFTNKRQEEKKGEKAKRKEKEKEGNIAQNCLCMNFPTISKKSIQHLVVKLAKKSLWLRSRIRIRSQSICPSTNEGIVTNEYALFGVFHRQIGAVLAYSAGVVRVRMRLTAHQCSPWYSRCAFSLTACVCRSRTVCVPLPPCVCVALVESTGREHQWLAPSAHSGPQNSHTLRHKWRVSRNAAAKFPDLTSLTTSAIT